MTGHNYNSVKVITSAGKLTSRGKEVVDLLRRGKSPTNTAIWSQVPMSMVAACQEWMKRNPVDQKI